MSCAGQGRVSGALDILLHHTEGLLTLKDCSKCACPWHPSACAGQGGLPGALAGPAGGAPVPVSHHLQRHLQGLPPAVGAARRAGHRGRGAAQPQAAAGAPGGAGPIQVWSGELANLGVMHSWRPKANFLVLRRLLLKPGRGVGVEARGLSALLAAWGSLLQASGLKFLPALAACAHGRSRLARPTLCLLHSCSSSAGACAAGNGCCLSRPGHPNCGPSHKLRPSAAGSRLCAQVGSWCWCCICCWCCIPFVAERAC